MKKFLIQVTSTDIYRIEVEAESEEEALTKHEDMWAEAEYSYENHYCTDGNTETDVLMEVKDED